jgi:hypothetical protein
VKEACPIARALHRPLVFELSLSRLMDCLAMGVSQLPGFHLRSRLARAEHRETCQIQPLRVSSTFRQVLVQIVEATISHRFSGTLLVSLEAIVLHPALSLT